MTTIAILSPAAPSEPQKLVQGQTFIKAQGYCVKLLPHAGASEGYLAGTDAERLADLHAAFEDSEIELILCARGGYGCMRLLPHIDWELIRRHPKPVIGFSDVTALLIPLWQRSGVKGFYGPMLTSNLVNDEPYSWDCLQTLLTGAYDLPYTIPNQDPYHCLTPGTAQGRLVGGNLSLLAALCGTPYQAQTSGCILFIEDWKESFYSLDRQFQQLRMAGLLEGITGLLLCDFSDTDWGGSGGLPSFDLVELFRRLTADLNVPVGYGFSVGHGEQTATLPIGVMAEFDASSGQLTLLEKAGHL
jgi:muramoyltetrapeptide carboxypeptidase